MKIKKADFVKSAVYEKDYPEQLEKMEFAFVGRSNVGKSSLINKMVSRAAKNSKAPTNKKTFRIPKISAINPPIKGPIKLPAITPVDKVPSA